MGRPKRRPAYTDSEGLEYWRCSKCGEAKTWFEFPSATNTTAGIDSWCKACKAKYQQGRYVSLSVRVKEQQAWIEELERRLNL